MSFQLHCIFTDVLLEILADRDDPYGSMGYRRAVQPKYHMRPNGRERDLMQEGEAKWNQYPMEPSGIERIE
jgi:hypothetical protein